MSTYREKSSCTQAALYLFTTEQVHVLLSTNLYDIIFSPGTDFCHLLWLAYALTSELSSKNNNYIVAFF